MIFRRSLCYYIVLAVVCALFPRGQLTAQNQTATDAPEQIYKAHSDLYFFKRSYQFRMESALKESFLAWLLEGINDEVRQRDREDLAGTLAALNPPELSGYDSVNYAMPQLDEKAPLRIRYLAWEKYQRDELAHKYAYARLVKDRLISNATPRQRDRMFRRDLEAAVIAYSDGLFSDAALYFTELIDRYGIGPNPAIYFYRAEANYNERLFDFAAADYQRVIELAPASDESRIAILRLIRIYGSEGRIDEVLSLWRMCDSLTGDAYDDRYWETLDITARTLMTAEDYANARDLFDRIPVHWGNSLITRLLAAECSLGMLELDDAFDRLSALLTDRAAQSPENEAIREEARLKLGYIYFLNGDYDIAFVELGKVKGPRELQEEVQIGSAWALYRLGAYNHAVRICDEFLKTYPESQYQYEAVALAGFCRERSGADSVALKNYQSIMSAIDDRQDYYDFNYERQALQKALSDLGKMEERIFVGGLEGLFDEYVTLRQRINKALQRLNMTESIKSSPFIKTLLEEQKELYKVYEASAQVEKQLNETEDFKLLNRYEDIVADLLDAAEQVNAAIRYQSTLKTLIQHEEDQRFTLLQHDSLRRQIANEWDINSELVQNIKNLVRQAEGVTDPELVVAMAALELELTDQRLALQNVQAELTAMSDAPVKSHLDKWADFAYQRYTYKGLKFEDYYAQQERVRELDGLLRSINRLMSQRQGAGADTVNLPDELAIASAPGESPFIAPRVAMWNSQDLPMESVERRWRGEPEPDALPDTTAAGETEPLVKPEPSIQSLPDAQSSEESKIDAEPTPEPEPQPQTAPEAEPETEPEPPVEPQSEHEPSNDGGNNHQPEPNQ